MAIHKVPWGAKLAKAALGRIANGSVKPEPSEVSNALNGLAKKAG